MKFNKLNGKRNVEKKVDIIIDLVSRTLRAMVGLSLLEIKLINSACLFTIFIATLKPTIAIIDDSHLKEDDPQFVPVYCICMEMRNDAIECLFNLYRR